MKRKRKQPKAVPCELAVNLRLMHPITEEELIENFDTEPIAEGKVAEPYRLRASHLGAILDSAAPEVFDRLDMKFAEILCQDNGTLKIRVKAAWPKGYENVLITYVDENDYGEGFEDAASSPERWLIHLLRQEGKNLHLPDGYWDRTDWDRLPPMRSSQFQRFMKTVLGAVLHSPKREENLPSTYAVVGDNKWYADTCEWWHGYKYPLPKTPLETGRLGEMKIEQL